MTINPIISDYTVFSAGKPIRIFGTGSGTVTVTLAGTHKTASFDGDTWLIELPAMDYGGPYELEIVTDGEKHVFSDIMIGDVLLLSGQSNVQFKLGSSTTDRPVFDNCGEVRMFPVDRPEEGEVFFSAGGWISCKKDQAKDWSALGYFIGNLLYQKTGHAVGLIVCCQGASAIESWLPPEVYETRTWQIAPEQKHIDYTYYPWNGVSYLYGYMLEKILPYSVGRVVWYQGESDTTDAGGAIYDRMLADMIGGWRAVFDDPSLPFLIVQIADFNDRNDTGWKSVQAAQERACRTIPGTTLAVSRDFCESNDIHPTTKSRLAGRIVELLG